MENFINVKPGSIIQIPTAKADQATKRVVNELLAQNRLILELNIDLIKSFACPQFMYQEEKP